jgi:CheY-like chemotaxis protein
MSSKNGPIVIIEDDEDDCYILREVFSELNIPNERKFFFKGEDLITYLTSTNDKPFMIISDVNLPGMDGNDIRVIINESDYLRQKAIPFIFLTTSSNKDSVDRAYKNMVQGYFIKPNKLPEVKIMIKMMVDYWSNCIHPNS